MSIREREMSIGERERDVIPAATNPPQGLKGRQGGMKRNFRLGKKLQVCNAASSSLPGPVPLKPNLLVRLD
jgi:hypothetical protein